MYMMKEYLLHNNESDGLYRRWFFDDYFDLTVWFSSEKRMEKFRLLYDLGPQAHSLRWDVASPEMLIHELYDDGESIPGKFKQVPMLGTATRKIPDDLYQRFIEAASNLDVSLRDQISSVIESKR